MLVESQKKLEGNARFEGFTIDLADELSKFLQFNYTIKLVDDGAYGSETSPGRAELSTKLCNIFTRLFEEDSFFKCFYTPKFQRDCV